MDFNSERSRQMLRSLMTPFVEIWGAKALHEAVDSVVSGRPAEMPPKGGGRRFVGKKSDGNEKPRSLRVAESISSDEETVSALVELAGHFEQRHFLPGTADVKNFLEMRGLPTYRIKGRSDALKVILQIASQMPAVERRKLIDEASAQGPSNLSPLAEAIKNAGKRLRPGEIGTAGDDSDSAKGSE